MLYDIPLSLLKIIKKQVSLFCHFFKEELRHIKAIVQSLIKLIEGAKDDENLNDEEDNYKFLSQL